MVRPRRVTRRRNGYLRGMNLTELLPARSEHTDLSSASLRRDLGSLYGKHFGADPRRERALLGSTSFLATWIAVRAITHAIRDGKGPFGNIAPGGTHIHHMTFGITGLLATGFLWMHEIGVGTRGGRRASRATAIAYGAGAALTLDEFALWLNLEDDYWTEKGRESVDAVVVFGAVMLLTAIGRKPLVEVLAMSRRTPRSRALLRRRRAVLHHPRKALKLVR